MTETSADNARHPTEGFADKSSHGTTEVESPRGTRHIPKSKQDTKVIGEQWKTVQQRSQTGRRHKDASDSKDVLQVRRRKKSQKHKPRKKSETDKIDVFALSADESGVESVTNRVAQRPSRPKKKENHIKVASTRSPSKEPPEP